jgi:hypothetical protein
VIRRRSGTGCCRCCVKQWKREVAVVVEACSAAGLGRCYLPPWLVGLVVAGGIALARRDVVTINGIEALRDPVAVERTLRDAGIDADIVEVPLTATAEHMWRGVWWWVSVDRPSGLTEDDFARLRDQIGLLMSPDAEGENTTELELPKGLPGHVTLFVGREAAPGAFTVDAYDRINELAPTGPSTALASTLAIPWRSAKR